MNKYPYNGYYALKPKVFERDDYTCQWCGKTIGDSITRYASEIGCYEIKLSKHDFVVHHIDGNKLNNKMENLVTVCRPCHQSYHKKGRTKERVEADRWRRNYYRLKKQKTK